MLGNGIESSTVGHINVIRCSWMWSCTINHQVKWVNAGAKRGRDKEHERDYSFILKMIKKIWATQNTNALVQQKFRMSFHSLDWHCNCDIAWKCTAKSLIRFHFVHLYMGACVCVCSTVERLTCLCEYVCVTRWLLANVNELGFFHCLYVLNPKWFSVDAWLLSIFSCHALT